MQRRKWIGNPFPLAKGGYQPFAKLYTQRVPTHCYVWEIEAIA